MVGNMKLEVVNIYFCFFQFEIFIFPLFYHWALSLYNTTFTKVHYAPGFILLNYLVEHSDCLYVKMERINFNYSLKNIPIPTKSANCLKRIDKIESVIKRMRWKAFFFLACNSSNANSNNCDNMKETFGFKSKTTLHKWMN